MVKIHVFHIRNLRKALNHGLILQKNHRVIEFSQKDWLKPYIEINTVLNKSKSKT